MANHRVVLHAKCRASHRYQFAQLSVKKFDRPALNMTDALSNDFLWALSRRVSGINAILETFNLVCQDNKSWRVNWYILITLPATVFYLFQVLSVVVFNLFVCLSFGHLGQLQIRKHKICSNLHRKMSIFPLQTSDHPSGYISNMEVNLFHLILNLI